MSCNPFHHFKSILDAEIYGEIPEISEIIGLTRNSDTPQAGSQRFGSKDRRSRIIWNREKILIFKQAQSTDPPHSAQQRGFMWDRSSNKKLTTEQTPIFHSERAYYNSLSNISHSLQTQLPPIFVLSKPINGPAFVEVTTVSCSMLASYPTLCKHDFNLSFQHTHSSIFFVLERRNLLSLL